MPQHPVKVKFLIDRRTLRTMLKAFKAIDMDALAEAYRKLAEGKTQ